MWLYLIKSRFELQNPGVVALIYMTSLRYWHANLVLIQKKEHLAM